MRTAIKSQKLHVGLAGALAASLVFGFGVGPAHGSTDATPAVSAAKATADRETTSSESAETEPAVQLYSLDQEDAKFHLAFSSGAYADVSPDGTASAYGPDGEVLDVLPEQIQDQDGNPVALSYTLLDDDLLEVETSVPVQDPGGQGVVAMSQPGATCYISYASGLVAVGSSILAIPTGGASVALGIAGMGLATAGVGASC